MMTVILVVETEGVEETIDYPAQPMVLASFTKVGELTKDECNQSTGRPIGGLLVPHKL